VTKRTNELANQNADNEHAQIVPTEPNLPTGANPTSTEPPRVSNSPINPILQNSNNQDNAMSKKTEVTPHSAAKGNYQLVPINANLPSKRSPRLKIVKDGDKEVVSPDATDRTAWRAELAEALASENVDFCAGIISRIAKATYAGNQSDEVAMNFVLSVVADGKPRDGLESMTLTQIGIFHLVVMDAARQYFRATTTAERHIAQNDLNKAARTFATLILALKSQRTGATPTVTVQNVSVSDGSQAIVGNVVTQAPGGTPAAADPPPVTISGSALPLNDNPKVETDDVQPLEQGRRQ